MKKDLRALIEAAGVGRFQVILLLLAGSLVFMDGFDTQAIGYVAPALVSDWGIPRAALGPIFSAGLAGLMLGAFILGPVADRSGRKLTLCLSALAFGLFSLACAAASSVEQLMLFRLLGGIGLGGAMPAGIALVTEFSPLRARGRIVTALVCCFSIGAAVGGFLTAGILPHVGWRGVFVVGGAVPLLLVPVVYAAMPESLHFLALRDPRHPAIAPILRRLNPRMAFDPQTELSVGHDEAHGDWSPLALFAEGRAGVTALLWVGFFMNLVVLYFLASYLPTVLSANGVAVGDAVRATAFYQVGGLAGALTMGWLMDRLRAPPLLGLALALAIAFILLIHFAGADLVLVALGAFGAGFCVVGGQIGANAYVGLIYPTAIRSTGVAWALGIGRFGSVLGPLAVTALLAAGWSMSDVLLAVCAPAAAAGLALYASGRVGAAGTPV
ncbi:MAG: MFS transporter [Xanthobacteraceae bacterium]|nr:MFS transporter [Xanthobacteraceae bacterium]